MIGEALTDNIVGLGYRGTAALTHGVRRKRASCVWSDASERLIERSGPLVTVKHVSAPPFQLRQRLAHVRKFADWCGQTTKLSKGVIGEWLDCGTSDRVDTDLGRGHIVQANVFGGGLIARAVMKIPALE